jgi:phage baseplate assembly protein W
MVTRVLSAEDGDLAKGSIRTSRSVPFSDIDLTFSVKDNGEIRKKTDAAAVKQAVKNLILTNHFEKPFAPRFGGNIVSMLFNLHTSDDAQWLRKNIAKNIEALEPRASVIDISTRDDPDYNSLYVTITFRVSNSRQVATVTTALSRLR